MRCYAKGLSAIEGAADPHQVGETAEQIASPHLACDASHFLSSWERLAPRMCLMRLPLPQPQLVSSQTAMQVIQRLLSQVRVAFQGRPGPGRIDLVTSEQVLGAGTGGTVLLQSVLSIPQGRWPVENTSTACMALPPHCLAWPRLGGPGNVSKVHLRQMVGCKGHTMTVWRARRASEGSRSPLPIPRPMALSAPCVCQRNVLLSLLPRALQPLVHDHGRPMAAPCRRSHEHP